MSARSNKKTSLLFVIFFILCGTSRSEFSLENCLIHASGLKKDQIVLPTSNSSLYEKLRFSRNLRINVFPRAIVLPNKVQVRNESIFCCVSLCEEVSVIQQKLSYLILIILKPFIQAITSSSTSNS